MSPELPQGHNRGWTPAMVHALEPPVLDLEEDYEARLDFPPGDLRRVLALGGIPVEVSTGSPGIIAYLDQAFAAFVTDEHPRVQIEIGVRADGKFPFATLTGTLMTYSRGPHLVGKFRQMAGYIDTVAHRGRALIEGDNHRQDLSNYLRLVMDSLTPSLGAVLFHTAAIASGDGAYLFYGPSTAGKSTMSKLSARTREILTDDMLILRRDGGGIRAATCGFWGGETKEYPSRRRDLPVRGFFRLRKGQGNELAAIPPKQGAFDLVCGVPSMRRSVRDQRFILDFADEASRKVPFRELTFHKRDDSFWSLLEALD